MPEERMDGCGLFGTRWAWIIFLVLILLLLGTWGGPVIRSLTQPSEQPDRYQWELSSQTSQGPDDEPGPWLVRLPIDCGNAYWGTDPVDSLRQHYRPVWSALTVWPIWPI